MSLSWDEYIKSSLIGTGCVKEAAIVGHSGAVWANSQGFQPTTKEIRELTKGLVTKPSSFLVSGFTVAGVSYKTFKADSTSLYGSLESSGIIICRTLQGLILACYDENIQPAQCADVTEKLADFLRSCGY